MVAADPLQTISAVVTEHGISIAMLKRDGFACERQRQQ